MAIRRNSQFFRSVAGTMKGSVNAIRIVLIGTVFWMIAMNLINFHKQSLDFQKRGVFRAPETTQEGARTFEGQHSSLPEIPRTWTNTKTHSHTISSVPVAVQSFQRINNKTREERCAINLYGLPRSFKSLVLPSLMKHVLQPNAKYNCDYFVYTNYIKFEEAGRSGQGGNLDPNEILELEPRVRAAAAASSTASQSLSSPPTVQFGNFTDHEFTQRYNDLLETIRTAKEPGSSSKLLYAVRNERNFNERTLVNIVKMFHQQEFVWKLMENHANANHIQYTRVAMLRADVMFLNPIDIFQTANNKMDVENRQAVIPAFAKYPVNDRMIYGPYRAVQIWASERFARLEEHVNRMHREKPGWGMHSEWFLAETILPAIRKEAGIEVAEHPGICFIRARVNDSVWLDDCISLKERIRYSQKRRATLQLKRRQRVEKILGRTCDRLTETPRVTLDCPIHVPK